MAPLPIMVLDRVISPGLEAALSLGGPLHPLVERSVGGDGLFDLQLRADPKTNRTWVSVYVGLTSVLNVAETNGTFRLSAHETHKGKVSDGPRWDTPMTSDELASQLVGIFQYVDHICTPGNVSANHTAQEGRLQGLLCAGSTTPTIGFQREAAVAFESDPIKRAITTPLAQRITDAAIAGRPEPAPKWWPGVRDHGAVPKLGLEADALGIDCAGRLLVVEVKPPGALKGIAWAPAQVRLYAEVIALWLEVDPDARQRIMAMRDQRAQIGLSAPSAPLPPVGAEKSSARLVGARRTAPCRRGCLRCP